MKSISTLEVKLALQSAFEVSSRRMSECLLSWIGPLRSYCRTNKRCCLAATGLSAPSLNSRTTGWWGVPPCGSCGKPRKKTNSAAFS